MEMSPHFAQRHGVQEGCGEVVHAVGFSHFAVKGAFATQADPAGGYPGWVDLELIDDRIIVSPSGGLQPKTSHAPIIRDAEPL